MPFIPIYSLLFPFSYTANMEFIFYNNMANIDYFHIFNDQIDF